MSPITLPITTWATLKTAVSDYLNRGDLEKQIELFIHMAQRKLERTNNFAYMLNRATTLTSEHYISIPARYKEGINFAVIENDRKYPMKKCTTEEILNIFTDLTNDTGRPRYYGPIESQSEFLVRPTPNTTYTFDHTYYRYSPVLSDSNTSNWLVTDAPELLLYSALLEAEPFLKNDKRIKTWAGMAAGALADIMSSETASYLRPNMRMEAV